MVRRTVKASLNVRPPLLVLEHVHSFFSSFNARSKKTLSRKSMQIHTRSLTHSR